MRSVKEGRPRPDAGGTYRDPNAAHSASLSHMFLTLWRHRALITRMARRDVVGRYKGSIVGVAWSFLNPLVMLAVYTFVFGVVFKARWGVTTSESRADFAIVLFVGLIVHALFADCVNRAPGLITSNVNFVKKVVFPLEVLPGVVLGSALFHAAVSICVLLLAMLANGNSIHASVAFVPAVIAPLLLWALGIGWLLASLGVFLRDIAQLTTILTTIMLFLAPVFFPISSMPVGFRPLIQLNPLTFIIEQMRIVLMEGRQPDWTGYAIYFSISVVVAWIGFWWFQRTRRGFADVL